MAKYEEVRRELLAEPKVWLITGVAGFIGSNLLETLLELNQTVIGLDNFSTGHQSNLDEVRGIVSEEQWRNFTFIDGDIRGRDTCRRVVQGVDYVLHQAALGSVPRSISDPNTTNATNISGFLNMLTAAKDENVISFTYAASSSTYGDHPALPKIEENIGSPLSPYAVTKYVNELYAGVFAQNYQFPSIGLRYFNVFGPRQDPGGVYAAVIPKWISGMIKNDDIFINGDGDTSRDFCFIANVVQVNILAATADIAAKDNVYNVAVGGRTSLKDLYLEIKASLGLRGVCSESRVSYLTFRAGDVRHSQASIEKAQKALGYAPRDDVKQGIKKAVDWYLGKEAK